LVKLTLRIGKLLYQIIHIVAIINFPHTAPRLIFYTINLFDLLIQLLPQNRTSPESYNSSLCYLYRCTSLGISSNGKTSPTFLVYTKISMGSQFWRVLFGLFPPGSSWISWRYFMVYSVVTIKDYNYKGLKMKLVVICYCFFNISNFLTCTQIIFLLSSCNS
jgi:hypothetical protein